MAVSSERAQLAELGQMQTLLLGFMLLRARTGMVMQSSDLCLTKGGWLGSGWHVYSGLAAQISIWEENCSISTVGAQESISPKS